MHARFAFVLALLLHGHTLAAQIRASEHASVEQTIDGTTITLEFYRPMTRGRTLFGDRGALVQSGYAWTPGANWATTIDASRDNWLGGQRLAKGKYGVWLIPSDTGDWTLFLDRETRRFHTMRARLDSAVLRLAVRPDQGSPLEGLMWYFPFVGGDSSALRLHWGSTMVTVPVRVDPSKPQTLAAAERGAYLGRYRVSWSGAAAPDNVVEILEAPNGIRGRSTPPLMSGTDADFDLFQTGQDRFRVVVQRGGRPFDTEWMELHFNLANGRATSIEVPNPKGTRVMGRAERLP